MGEKLNFIVLFPIIFSCHFGLHFLLFLTEWNGNLSLFLVFKTDLFSAQLDLWSQEHKVVFFSFWRQTSCDGQIVRINYTKWGNKLEWKASLSLLVMHFFFKDTMIIMHVDDRVKLTSGPLPWFLFLIASQLISQNNMLYNAQNCRSCFLQ